MGRSASETLLERLAEGAVGPVLVTPENLDDIGSVYDCGLGRYLGMKEPEVGDLIEVDDLVLLIENAHNNGQQGEPTE